jgi:putative MATE family efflux protein
VILSGIVGILLTIAGLFAAKPLLGLLGTPTDIFDNASVYLMTMIAGTIAVTAYNMAASILRAFGDGKSPLIAMVIAALVNVALDLLFVLVFRWGVFGAALASVLAQSMSFLYCFFRIRRIECVKLDAEAWKIDWKMMRDFILFGIPLVVQYVIICIGGIILQSAINGEGSIFIAGYTATNKLYGLLECAGISTGTAISTYFSQNYGAGQMDRVRSGVRSGVKIVTVMALVVMTLVFIFRKYMLMLIIWYLSILQNRLCGYWLRLLY